MSDDALAETSPAPLTIYSMIKKANDKAKVALELETS